VGTKEKLIKRLKSKPKDFTYDEMKAALTSMGFKESNKGKTSGSRVEFRKDGIHIHLHKPHGKKELLDYQMNKILVVLEKEGLL